MASEGHTLPIPCRYYRVYTDTDVACVEANFGFVERVLPVPLNQSALVLVDVWSTHYIDSWLERARRMTAATIVPILAAARGAGMTVIHAPSPFIADRYLPAPEAPAPREQSLFEWPPADFRGIYRGGEYASFGRNPEPRLSAAMERYVTDLDIAETVCPVAGEPIIHTGQQMHGLLAQRGILHLIYVGFVTNWCLIGRDYGVIAMNDRGYNVIVVRDATTGIEFHDTVDALAATNMTIREVETKYAWSTHTQGLLGAFEAARQG